MEICSGDPMHSLQQNNTLFTHGLASVRSCHGHSFYRSHSSEVILHFSNNSNGEASNIPSNNRISTQSTLSLPSHTSRSMMLASNPIFEQKSRLPQLMLSRSFNSVLWAFKSCSDDSEATTVHCSVKSYDQRHWNRFLTSRAQLLQCSNWDHCSYDSFSVAGGFSAEDLYGERTPKRKNDGLKFHYSLFRAKSRRSSVADVQIMQYGANNSEKAEIKNISEIVDPEDISVDIQIQNFRNPKSHRRIIHKIKRLSKDRNEGTESKLQTQPTVSEQRSVKMTCDNNSASNEGDEFVKSRFTTEDLIPDTKLSIAQLWEQESQDHRTLRRYRRSSTRWRGGVTYLEYERYLHEVTIKDNTKEPSRAVKKHGSFCYYACLGNFSKSLVTEFREQRTRLFALAKMPFDHSNQTHISLLQEIYCQLITHASSKGEHWKDLGFRGVDPALELKNSGMLTLMFMLYFYKSDSLAAQIILSESKRDGEVYPFAAMCTVATSWVLKLIKKGKLNNILKEMKVDRREWIGDKEERFLLASKKLFVGLMYKFHWTVTRGHADITDVTKAVRQVERDFKKDVEIIVRIADLPDILYLGENIFRRLTPFQQLRQSIKLTCTCFTPKKYVPDED